MTQVFNDVFTVLITNEQGYCMTDMRNTLSETSLVLSVAFENGSSGERAEYF